MVQDVYAIHSQKVQNLLLQIQTITRLKPLEFIILTVYPMTILLGQLINYFSFNNANELLIDNYYTNKKNLLNSLFVKKGWFWTFIVLIYFRFQHHSNIPIRTVPSTPLTRLRAFVIRFTIGTIWWILFTQWFFGLPIMDRIFILTGGVCQYEILPTSSIKPETIGMIGSVVCRKLKGNWIGGHDPSGHVFLLVHSSVMLSFELLEIGALDEVHLFVEKFKRIQGSNDDRKLIKLVALFLGTSSIILIALLGLWWWMLLITSCHFHSFFEKITGLIAAYLGISIYLIPRFL